jgi:hypothetical protein
VLESGWEMPNTVTQISAGKMFLLAGFVEKSWK